MFYYIRQVISVCLGYLHVNCAAGTGLLGPKLNDLLEMLTLQDSCSSMINPGKKKKKKGKLFNSPSKKVQLKKEKIWLVIFQQLKLGMPRSYL